MEYNIYICLNFQLLECLLFILYHTLKWTLLTLIELNTLLMPLSTRPKPIHFPSDLIVSVCFFIVHTKLVHTTSSQYDLYIEANTHTHKHTHESD